MELVVLAEAFARRAGVDPSDWWDYVYRRKPWPVELRAALVDAFFPALTPSSNDATTATMTANEIAPPRKGPRPVNPDHPLVRALKKEGVSFAELGRAVKRSRQSVASWVAEGDANRPIPRDVAKYIKDEYGVPLSAWPRIAD